ncbi:hypothetical protein EVAR_46327_1 [Eumeta japonica]|uniref:Nucleic-acid-binding protein from transposon X-element n=1 Tax=Eumeta variegata TaxID=151549 RepID=A0A4C1WUN4_EUMVA|nr:hypothetical protein EVAR_46327_1 [Eumeta japonica]
MSSTDDFRMLNSYLIKNNIPFHTYALEEERKMKTVIKGIPVEIETEDTKSDLERQEYPVQAVHRMHHRDGTALGILGQCHRCQLYSHAATNCHVPPRCVKCLDPHWTKERARTRESGGKPTCCNCRSEIQPPTEGVRQHRNSNRKIAAIICERGPQTSEHSSVFGLVEWTPASDRSEPHYAISCPVYFVNQWRPTPGSNSPLRRHGRISSALPRVHGCSLDNLVAAFRRERRDIAAWRAAAREPPPASRRPLAAAATAAASRPPPRALAFRPPSVPGAAVTRIPGFVGVRCATGGLSQRSSPPVSGVVLII